MNRVEYGPMLEETMLSAGLDYYKPTMSQLEYEEYPDAEVTFTFKNRSQDRLAEYVEADDLQARLDFIRERGWSENELGFLGRVTDSQGEPLFKTEYLNYLRENQLPPVNVRLDPKTDDLAIDSTGDWPLVTFWETIVMSEVNEAYFEGFVKANDIDLQDLYDEGDRRLTEKIEYLQQHPEVKVAEFGTRRRFSLRWQKHVVDRLMKECPDNLVGTCNVAIANVLDVKPAGTFAHELPMVYAGIADAFGRDIRQSHSDMLDDWHHKYGGEQALSIALSDTFGTDFFFKSLTPEQAENFYSTRQDSGDPIEYGNKALAFYKHMGIDPSTKRIVFSDSLDFDKVEKIRQSFIGKIGIAFGIGTNLTNDLGLEANNNVMKATHVRLPNGAEADLVKLSDNPGKHTGPQTKVNQYQEIFNGTPTCIKT